MANGSERIRAISTSNTKNKTDKRKKRRENGIRDLDMESNPHSNGDSFSLILVGLD